MPSRRLIIIFAPLNDCFKQILTVLQMKSRIHSLSLSSQLQFNMLFNFSLLFRLKAMTIQSLPNLLSRLNSTTIFVKLYRRNVGLVAWKTTFLLKLFHPVSILLEMSSSKFHILIVKHIFCQLTLPLSSAFNDSPLVCTGIFLSSTEGPPKVQVAFKRGQNCLIGTASDINALHDDSV